MSAKILQFPKQPPETDEDIATLMRASIKIRYQKVLDNNVQCGAIFSQVRE